MSIEEDNMILTENTRIEDCFNSDVMINWKNVLLDKGQIASTELTFLQYQEKYSDFIARDVVTGLNRLIELKEQGIKVMYEIWANEDRNAQLFFFPGRMKGPYVVICPGGAYSCVCSMKEGFPVAAKLNELGYSAFVLHYNVGGIGLMPKPMEDLAQALKFINKNKAKFNVDMEQYALIGFSSGGHLVGEWGTENCGARWYGMHYPQAIILGYPASDLTLIGDRKAEQQLKVRMLGENYTENEVLKYTVSENVHRNYPPTYLFHCRDDSVIPFETSVRIKEKLEHVECRCKFKEIPIGGHGFGFGTGTLAEGWLNEAIEFWRK